MIDPSRRQPSRGGHGDTLRRLRRRERTSCGVSQFDRTAVGSTPIDAVSRRRQAALVRRTSTETVRGRCWSSRPAGDPRWTITLYCLAMHDGHDAVDADAEESRCSSASRHFSSAVDGPLAVHDRFGANAGVVGPRGSTSSPGSSPAWSNGCRRDGRRVPRYWSAGYVNLPGPDGGRGAAVDTGWGREQRPSGREPGGVRLRQRQRLGAGRQPRQDLSVLSARPPRAFLVFPRLDSRDPERAALRSSTSGWQRPANSSVWVSATRASERRPSWPQLPARPGLRPVAREALGSDHGAIHKGSKKAGQLDHRLGDRDPPELCPVLVHDGGRSSRSAGRSPGSLPPSAVWYNSRSIFPTFSLE